MSWLIEAYFEEGKHGPDHPESLNMEDKYDFKKKQLNNEFNSAIENQKTNERFKSKVTSNPNYYKSYSDKDREELDKSIDNAKSSSVGAAKALEKGDKETSDKLNKETKENLSKVANVHRKVDATDRHNRRHPINDAAEIIEILQ